MIESNFMYVCIEFLILETLIVICVSRPKSASFSSEFQFSDRGAAEA
jgi:hypothetical protein